MSGQLKRLWACWGFKQTHYPAARFDLDGKGMTLLCSQPPVSKRLVAVPTAIQEYSG